MKQLFRRPSPAMVVAVIALIAGLSGTAIGATVLSKKQVVKIARKQANHVIDQRGLALTHFYVRFGVAQGGNAREDTGALCDAGDIAVAGGYDLAPFFDSPTTPRVFRDAPPVAGKNPMFQLSRGWAVGLLNTEGRERLYAVCVEHGTARFDEPPFPQP